MDENLDHLEQRELLRTSKFDAVSALLLSVLMLVGMSVAMLFVMWWDSRVTLPVRPMELLIENAAGRGDNAAGFARDFEPPGAEEVEAITEPTMQDMITAVTNAVSSVAGAMESFDSSSDVTSQGGGGKGDSRPPGPEGEGEDIVPRSLRWQLNFTAKNLSTYAEQLDFFKIELAALGGTQIQGVDYASGLAGTPKIRRGKSETEKRLYFMWTTKSALEQFDRQLLQKAGIPLGGRQILKFLEPDFENALANYELDYAKKNGHQSVTEIAKTIFESQTQDGKYIFVVIDQRYRKRPKK